MSTLFQFTTTLRRSNYAVSPVQFLTVPMRSEKPTCAPPSLSKVSPTLPLKRPLSSFKKKKKKSSSVFFLSMQSSPDDRCCDVLGFVLAGSVSSSSTLQIFRDANHLRGQLHSIWSFPMTPACLGQYTHRSFQRRMSNSET